MSPRGLVSCPRAEAGEEDCGERFCPDCGLPRRGATGALGPLRLVVDSACGSHVAISCFDGPEDVGERVGTLMLEPATWRALGGGDLLERFERLGGEVELRRDNFPRTPPWIATATGDGRITALGEGGTAEAALRDALERAEALR